MRQYCKNAILNREDVLAGYIEWSQHMSGRLNDWRVKKEFGCADRLIDEILREVHGRSLTFRPIRYRDQFEPNNGKIRHIGVECVKQQVVEYVFFVKIRDMYNAKIGRYQTAGTVGRGGEYASRAAKRFMKDSKYYIYSDIRKCYPSVNHDAVRAYYRKYLRSYDMLYIVDALLDTFGTKGLNLGGYFSLVTCNLLLSEAYHHCESLHSKRRGKQTSLVKHQLWLMDDFWLFSDNKKALKIAYKSLLDLISQNGWELKGYKIRRCDCEPATVYSYVVAPTRITIKSRTFLRARRSMKRFDKKPCIRRAMRVVSYYGYFKHSNSRHVVKTLRARRALAQAKKTVAQSDREIS